MELCVRDWMFHEAGIRHSKARMQLTPVRRASTLHTQDVLLCCCLASNVLSLFPATR